MGGYNMKKIIPITTVLLALAACGEQDEPVQRSERTAMNSTYVCENEMAHGNLDCCETVHDSNWCYQARVHQEDEAERRVASRFPDELYANDMLDLFEDTAQKTPRGYSIFLYHGTESGRAQISDEFDAWDAHRGDLCNNTGTLNVRPAENADPSTTLIALCRPQPARETCTYEGDVNGEIVRHTGDCLAETDVPYGFSLVR
jgi:hypothetical protein